MVDHLAAAFERVQIGGAKAGPENLDAWIDDDASKEYRPHRKPFSSSAALKEELEAEFLTPPTSFNAQWLNRLQQRWNPPTNYADICEFAPTQTRTILRFTREGLEGRVTGYREVTVPASSLTAKNSTSILRRPANRADFVRGAAGFFPFTPGGLDGIDVIDAIEREAQLEDEKRAITKGSALDRIINFGTEGSLLEIAPGFSRGLKFPKKNGKKEVDSAADVETALENDDVDEKLFHRNGQDNTKDDVRTSDPLFKRSTPPESDEDDQDLEELLPIEFPALEPRGQLLASSTRTRGQEWAHVVDVNKGMDNFHELVPEMAKTWPFELDTFQKEAVYHLESLETFDCSKL